MGDCRNLAAHCSGLPLSGLVKIQSGSSQAQGRKKGRRSAPAFCGSFAPNASRLMTPCVVDFRKPKELKQPDV